MSSLAMVRLQLRALELKLGVERGGFCFWLFVFNCLASLVLVCVLVGLVHWIFFILAAIGATGVIAFVDVVKIWNKVVAD